MPRSLAQLELERECEKISARRARDAAFLATLDFVSAVSTSLVTMDIFGLMGVPILLTFAASTAAIVFFSVLAFTVVCGVLCGIYAVIDAIRRRNAELRLMQDNIEKVERRDYKLTVLNDWLEHAAKLDSYINERYQFILRHENVEENIRVINKHLKLTINTRLAGLVPQREKPTKYEKIEIPPPRYTLGRVIAFFSGAGFTLGVLASIIGVSTLPALLFTPVGWLMLGIMIGLAVVVGYLMQRYDFKARLSQQNHMDELQANNEKLDREDSKLDNTITRIQALLLSQPKLEAAAKTSIKPDAKSSFRLTEEKPRLSYPQVKTLFAPDDYASTEIPLLPITLSGSLPSLTLQPDDQ